MIRVVIGKLINGVVVLGRSYYSGSGWYNDDGSFYIWVCCNGWVIILQILRYTGITPEGKSLERDNNRGDEAGHAISGQC